MASGFAAAIPEKVVLGGLWGVVDYGKPGLRWIQKRDLIRSRCPSDANHTYTCQATKQSPLYPGLTIASDIDLHNRADLLRTLGMDFPDSPDNDALVLAAYSKWGTRCAEFLLGDFAFAIFDQNLQRLFCCRDHIGFRSFLYWHNHSRFIFASDIKLFFEGTDVPRRLNRRKLAALSVPTAELAQHEETFHEGILSLPPGTWMTVDGNGIRRQRYWEPKPGEYPAVPSRPEEADEALREILFAAVECRLDTKSPVAAMLSGGLDSSGVVAIAAQCLERKNRQLLAVSAILPEETRSQFADERDFIDEFRSWNNIHIKYVTGQGRGPFDTLRDSCRFEALFLRNSRFYLEEELEKAALAEGARGILCGTGGELAVTAWSERYYLELAVRLRFPTLFREFRKRKTLPETTAPRTMARQILNTLFPLRPWSPFLLLTREFQRECQDRPALRGRCFTLRQSQLENLRFWISKHAIARGQSVTLMPQISPLADKRILEFCLALPASMDIRHGYQRYPIRGALDGLLPPKIQWRTGKLAFSPDYFIRYNAQLRMARDFVAEIAPNDPVRSIIDVNRVSSLLHTVDPEAGNALALEPIPVSLYTINFLRQFSDFRS